MTLHLSFLAAAAREAAEWTGRYTPAFGEMNSRLRSSAGSSVSGSSASCRGPDSWLLVEDRCDILLPVDPCEAVLV